MAMRVSDEPVGGLTLTVQHDCRLAGAPKALLAALKKTLTIDNPKYQDAQKYGRWVGKRLKPYLYFFEMAGSEIAFPRGFGNNAVRMCRRYAPECALTINDQRRECPPVELTFQGELRPYQQDAVHDVLSHDFGVVESGTGSGKTVIALAVIAHRQQPTMILVHTKELLYQWAERIETFLGISPGLIGDGHFEVAPVTVAIVNSARNRLDELPEHFGQICVDECHRVPSSLFTDVVQAFDCRYMLGLSATAFRRDGLTKLIYFFLGDRTHRVDAERLHLSGAVLKPEFIQRATGFSFYYRDNYQALMTALTTDEARNRQIADDVAAEVGVGCSTILVVSDRVAHCQKLAELLAERKNSKTGREIAVAVLTGRLGTEERAAIVEAIKADEVEVVISTVQLIGEGFDCPGLDTLFLTTPIKFTGRLLQVVGRILRPAEGKMPRVFDYLDPVGVLKSSARARARIYQDGQQGVLPGAS